MPSRVSRTWLSLKLPNLRFDEVYLPRCLQNWAKNFNIVKFPLNVPSGGKSCWPWQLPHQVHSPQKSLNSFSDRQNRKQMKIISLSLPKLPLPHEFPCKLMSLLPPEQIFGFFGTTRHKFSRHFCENFQTFLGWSFRRTPLENFWRFFTHYEGDFALEILGVLITRFLGRFRRKNFEVYHNMTFRGNRRI